MVETNVGSNRITQADIKLSKHARVGILPEKQHDSLIDYLLSRIESDKSNRDTRSARFARIDKAVSTWQKLTPEDSNRKTKQETTGQGQAVSISLPIIHTHMDDMVSFFCGVYAPNSGSFYEEPNDDSQDKQARLDAIKRMNGDAKKNKYFRHLMRTMRALFKYNIGGFLVEWWPLGDSKESGDGSNHVLSLDMYNLFWDPTVDEPSQIPGKAEWAAWAERVNRMSLIKGEKNGEYAGVGRILTTEYDTTSNGNMATYYRYPPNHAGLQADGSDATTSKGSRANWDSYGVSLPGENSVVNLENAHEIVHMYCWLNAEQFGLNPAEVTIEKGTYTLFKFVILDGKRIIQASVVQSDDENPQEAYAPRIPIFVGYLNQDDMGIAQRSVAELLQPFQSYGSFLLNAHVAGARSAIWGIQGYDPDMFDLGAVPEGEVTARLASKKPGRDVRSGLMKIDGVASTGQAMDDLAKLMGLVDKFFPGQALPSQIAGIDRAVNSQVAAVMQGVNRRLHMLVRTIDDDILGPTRLEQVLNMLRNGVGSFSGMSESDIMNFIGSGLAQLNREVAAQAMQQLLFAIIQNPKANEQYDVIGLMNYWAGMMNMDVDLNKFKLQQQAPTDVPLESGAPPMPPIAA